MMNCENDEKSKTRNLLTSILPPELLQNLEYEFSFDKKHESILCKNEPNSVFSNEPISVFVGEVNPYHSWPLGRPTGRL